MVKADPKRNYYADLEVPQDATTDDIRRQFRKLALKYHPDRNPGKEDEVVPRFQAIQCANEVLGDPDQRAKYDAERKKVTGGLWSNSTYPKPGAPNVPPRSAYAATSQFPPPPRRTRPAPPPTARSEYPSNASRFTNFPRPPPTATRPPPTRDDAQKRASAWQNMHKPKIPSPSTQDESFINAQRAKAWNGEDLGSGLGRSNTTRAPPPPRPGVYDPTQRRGDESQAPGPQAYASRYPRPPPPRVQTDVPPAGYNPSPNAAKAHPNFRNDYVEEVPFAEGTPRGNAPYTMHSGEKTYLGGTPIGRSSSQRSSSRPESADQPRTPAFATEGRARTRSASPPRNMFTHHTPSAAKDKVHAANMNARRAPSGGAGNATRPFVAYSESESEEEPVSERQWSSHSAHAPNAGYTRPAAPPHHHSKLSPDDAAKRPANNMYDEISFSMPLKTSPRIPWSQRWPFGNSKQNGGAKKPPYWAIPSTVSPRVVSPKKPKLDDDNEEQQQVPTTSMPAQAKQPITPVPPSPQPQDQANMFESSSSFSWQNIFANKLPPRRFNMPVDDTMFEQQPRASAFKSRSSESINTRFSPNEWNGKFQGEGDYFMAGPPPPRNATRGRTSPTKRGPPQRRPVPPRPDGPSPSEMPPPPPPVPERHTRPTSSSGAPSGSHRRNVTEPQPGQYGEQLRPGEARFSEEEWKNTFRDATWMWPPKPPSPPASTTERRGSRASKTRTPANAKAKAIPRPASVDDVDNEDTDVLRGKLPDSPPESVKSDNAMEIDTDVPAAREEPRSAPAPQGPKIIQTNLKSARKGSEGSFRPGPSEASLGLNDLANVAPFKPSQNGVAGMGDLATSLPFTSAPSPSHPLKHAATRLELPPAPQRPTEPERLTQQSWKDHLQRMQTYMTQWDTFNASIVAHFSTRLSQRLNMTNTNWLGAVGETTGNMGYQSYMQACKQDASVREYWDAECRKHGGFLEDFGRLRERVASGPLPVA